MNQQFEEETFDTQSLDTRLWRKILALFMRNKKTFYSAIAAVLVEATVTAAIPFFNRYAIDVFFLGSGSNRDILVFSALYALLILIQAYAIYRFIYLCGLIEMDISYQTRQDAMEKLQNLSFSYYDKTPSGWIMARVTSDIARLSEILSWSLIDLIWGGFMMVILFVLMMVVNVRLALIVVISIPLIYGISLWFQKAMLVNYRKIRAVNSKITSGFSEGISGAKTTKTMALEALHFSEFSALTHTMRSRSLHAIVLSAVYMPVVAILSSLGNAGVLWQGAQMVVDGVILVGTLILFTQYAGNFFEPLRNVTRILAQLQMAQASAERVLSLLEKEVDLKDSDAVIEKYGTILQPNEAVYEPLHGDIEFRNVDFHYNEDEPILRNFNLKIKPKQRIALVGETGSGKSTIINLICRFYEPVGGELLIDGVDYRQRSIGWLHSHLGYVLQAPHLFSGSVKDNIRYGRLDASDEEIIAAAKMVDAHDFIMDLEQGYDSDVGEGGGKLSTGQKQLVSFARALLAQPSIFVLDEATSSIDTETEVIIQKAIDSVLKEKTSFIVAHRLSTIVNADRILVIADGSIIEDGTHQQLLERRGHYFNLYTHQFNESMHNELISQLSHNVSG